MNSRRLVDPELLPALEILPQFQFSEEILPSLRVRREEIHRQASANWPATPHIEKREILVPSTDGPPDVRVLTYRQVSASAPRPVYVQIHGGGYVMSTADMCERQNIALVEELDCVVMSVDYRLAPDIRFPGSISDCYAALKWLHQNADELGVDAERIAVGGESSGGGLAASLVLMARDRGEVPIIHQHLVYPMLDDRLPAQPHPYTGEFGWTEESNRFGWRALLGHEPGGPDVSPYAAAARAEDLEGLPPTFIGVGALDLFLEQDIEYARRLTRAGVSTELHVYPGAFHGSDMIMPSAQVTRQFVQDRLRALRTAFQRGPQSGAAAEQTR